MLDVNRMVDAVLSAVGAPILALAKRVAALEERAPKDGAEGPRGEPGPAGPPGPPGDDAVIWVELDRRLAELEAKATQTLISDTLAQYDAALREPDRIAKAVEKYLAENPPVAGRDGVDGKDGAPGAPGERGEIGPIGERGADGAAGRDGVDGKDGAPGEQGEIGPIGERGADGAAGRDGPIGPDGHDGIDGAAGERGEKGAAGRDGVGLAGALIGRDGDLAVTLSDGNIIALGAVVGRDGAPGPKGEAGDRGEQGLPGELGERGLTGERGADGFGFEDMTEEMSDDGRVVIRRYTKGELVKEFCFALPAILDRGVYKHGETYQAGDTVTWAGSMWIAQRETIDKPGDGDGWRLSAKKGRDGKDGKDGAPGERGPQGIPGRDGRAL